MKFLHENSRRTLRWAAGMLATSVVASVLGFAPAAHAAVYDVPCKEDSLIKRIENAQDGDILRLSKKCDYEFDERYGNTDFALPPITVDLTIYGRGATLERDVEDEDSQWSHFSILQIGDLQTSPEVKIYDLSIEDGSLLTPPNEVTGAGCVAVAGADVFMSKVTVEDCEVFVYNFSGGALALGGGIAVIAGDLVMERSTVKDNEVTVLDTSDATSGGGGIASIGGSLSLEDTSVKGNEVSAAGVSDPIGFAGGIGAAGVFAMLDGKVSKNTAATTGGNGAVTLGGGLYFGGGTDAEIADSDVVKNKAKTKGNAGGALGGGIVNLGELFVDTEASIIDEDDLDETDIKDNVAKCDGFCLAVGGGYANTDGTDIGSATFTDTTFKYNKAEADEGVGLGGGLFVAGEETTVLIDSDVTKNKAKGDIWSAGGGIFATEDDSVVLDDTDVDRNKPDDCWMVPACG